MKIFCLAGEDSNAPCGVDGEQQHTAVRLVS